MRMNIKGKLSDLARFQTILKVLATYGFAPYLKEWGVTGKLNEGLSTASTAERLRKACEELGPTFIKLGQLLSTRPDILPEEFTNEFAKLRDQIPSFEFSQVLEILKKEFDQDPFEIFSWIDEKPLAAASIAQVHRAKIKSSDQPVVIKIQRPGIRKTIQSDIQILYVLASALERIHSDFKLFNLPAVIKEFQRSIHEELDFTQEARNIDLFHENFPAPEGIVLPQVFWNATTQRILTMTEIAGTSLSQIKSFPPEINRRHLAECAVTFFFESMLFHGLFHADAHPGNVLLVEEAEGKLGLLDFGMVGHLGPRLRQKLSQLFMAIVSQDYESLAVIYMDIGEFQENFSLREFQGDIEALLSPQLRKSIREVDLGKLLNDTTRLARKYKVRLPRDLVMFYRSLITLEHLGRVLDPEFEFLTYGRKFAEQLVRRRFSKEEVIKDIFKMIDGIRSLGVELPIQLKSLVRNMERNQIQNHSFGGDNLVKELKSMNRRLVLLMTFVSLLWGSLFAHTSNVSGLLTMTIAGAAIFIFFLLVLSLRR